MKCISCRYFIEQQYLEKITKITKIADLIAMLTEPCGGDQNNSV